MNGFLHTHPKVEPHKSRQPFDKLRANGICVAQLRFLGKCFPSLVKTYRNAGTSVGNENIFSGGGFILNSAVKAVGFRSC